MRSFTIFSAVLSVFAAATPIQDAPTGTDQELAKRVSSLAPVAPSGNAFWTGNTRFYMRGIDYQPGGSSALIDPLANATVCQRDIVEFKKLGINTVRVYVVDNSVNHDICMQALAKAGIYLILDVTNPLYSINPNAPASSYNAGYLQSLFATIDAFASYTNTLAFIAGDQVINEQANSTLAAPYVKATIRDMRQYIGDRGYRKISVGYSAADNNNLMQLAEYLNCGTDNERSDFFAYNDYSWCDPSSFTQSGWDKKPKEFTGYGLPVFLSEYGCATTTTRDFQELSALMSSEMTSVYSGGLMYEYSEEGDGYGIVTISDNQVSESTEFTAFASALSAYPAPTGSGGFTSTTNSVACPTQNSLWQVSSNTLPAVPDAAKPYFTAGAGSGPGLKASGSQTLTTSSVTATASSVSLSATGSTSRSTRGSVTGITSGFYNASTTSTTGSATGSQSVTTSGLITSTVQSTIVVTITSCASTVTNCPVGSMRVVTSVIDLYTTVCPASTVATPFASISTGLSSIGVTTTTPVIAVDTPEATVVGATTTVVVVGGSTITTVPNKGTTSVTKISGGVTTTIVYGGTTTTVQYISSTATATLATGTTAVISSSTAKVSTALAPTVSVERAAALAGAIGAAALAFL